MQSLNRWETKEYPKYFLWEQLENNQYWITLTGKQSTLINMNFISYQMVDTIG